MQNDDHYSIAIIGLGYVGLPLAVEFGKIRPVVGFDINKDRVVELRSGLDSTKEVLNDELTAAKYLTFTHIADDIKKCNFFIVTVPTPIDEFNKPDFKPLISASQLLGKFLKKGDIVVYESTVYPGATEEVCVPILESASGLKYNKEFYCGYSPERINPGDREHRLATIKKVTSGSTPEIADLVDDIYRQIIVAGTHKATSIRVAEAAKVIENTQRDLNIALMNELSLIFERMNIDTTEVLEAARTKWNFLPFSPGLVGGHCIGVDPYYLTHKAEQLGYLPEVILAGRRINDNMSSHIVLTSIKLMIQKNINVNGGTALILGISFKENCPDIRNSKVVDIISGLNEYGMKVEVYDPLVNSAEVESEYGLKCINSEPSKEHYDLVIFAVAHSVFKDMGADRLRKYAKPNCVFYDVKSVLPRNCSDVRL